MNKNDFLDCLLGCPRGQIVLCNILDGLDEGLFSQDFVREVFHWWHRYFLFRFPAAADCGEDEELLATLDLLLFAPPPPAYPGSATRPDFRLACNWAEKKPEDEGYAHVTDVHGFIYHLMSSEGRERNLDDILVDPEPTGKEVEGFNLKGPRKVQLKGRNVDGSAMTLGRRGKVLWHTAASGLVQKGKVTSSADDVRDRLGLIHYAKGTALMAIRIPADVLATGKTGRPTFADAGSHARFKAGADSATHRDEKAWGHAADLKLVATGGKVVDGWPERVAEPIPTARFRRREVETLPLQTLADTRGLTDSPPNRDDHQAFAERLLARHTDLNTLRNRVLAVIT